MDPVAFTIFGIEVRWYGIFIALSVVIGTLLAISEGKKRNISEDNIMDLLLYAIPVSIIGARLYYVIFSWDHYRGNFKEIINLRNGGLAIHGAIIGAVITGFIFCKLKKISFLKMGDITAPSLILGQAIGRWGNFANQEAHGGPTNLPWGIIVKGVKVHPTFLYESIWNFLVFLFLLWYRKNKQKNDGEVFILYFILYSIARFFIEGLRTDSLMFGQIRVAQMISLIIIIIGSIIYGKIRKR